MIKKDSSTRMLKKKRTEQALKKISTRCLSRRLKKIPLQECFWNGTQKIIFTKCLSRNILKKKHKKIILKSSILWLDFFLIEVKNFIEYQYCYKRFSIMILCVGTYFVITRNMY